FRLLFISPNKSRNEAKRNDGKISKNRKLVDGLAFPGTLQSSWEFPYSLSRVEFMVPCVVLTGR
ncbi:MAG: hypothetical protein FWC43_04315, partial [Planctomycetaceae bacterium]|nr:hypothetical protein [Planctomycetaceae bacterium]